MFAPSEDRYGRRRVGLAIALVTAMVSGVAVFINGYGVRAWADVTDTTTYTTFKNVVAATVLFGLALAAGRLTSTEGLRRPTGARQWSMTAVVAIVGGSIPFALFFEGLARASSGQAAFIHKTLVVWVGILAVVFLRERISVAHIAAIGLLVLGQVVLLGGLSDLSLGSGEALMLAATLLWSVETVVAKRLLADIPALTLGVARMGGGAVILLAITAARGGLADIALLQLHHVLWVLATGAVLSMYVASWYLALARAQAVDVTAVLVGGALITAALNVGVRGLSAPDLGGVVLVGAGVALAALAGLRRNRPVTVA